MDFSTDHMTAKCTQTFHTGWVDQRAVQGSTPIRHGVTFEEAFGRGWDVQMLGLLPDMKDFPQAWMGAML